MDVEVAAGELGKYVLEHDGTRQGERRVWDWVETLEDEALLEIRCR